MRVLRRDRPALHHTQKTNRSPPVLPEVAGAPPRAPPAGTPPPISTSLGKRVSPGKEILSLLSFHFWPSSLPLAVRARSSPWHAFPVVTARSRVTLSALRLLIPPLVVRTPSLAPASIASSSRSPMSTSSHLALSLSHASSQSPARRVLSRPPRLRLFLARLIAMSSNPHGLAGALHRLSLLRCWPLPHALQTSPPCCLQWPPSPRQRPHWLLGAVAGGLMPYLLCMFSPLQLLRCSSLGLHLESRRCPG